jgi:asparagine synthase (glutamine-hydrolysing)
LPASAKLRGGEGKYLLKEALRPLLPEAVLFRKKMGFGVPMNLWFRGALRAKLDSIVRGPRIADSGLFDRQALVKLVAEHQSGRRDHNAVLWSIIMFDEFLRNAAAASPAGTVACSA